MVYRSDDDPISVNRARKLDRNNNPGYFAHNDNLQNSYQNNIPQGNYNSEFLPEVSNHGFGNTVPYEHNVGSYNNSDLESINNIFSEPIPTYNSNITLDYKGNGIMQNEDITVDGSVNTVVPSTSPRDTIEVPPIIEDAVATPATNDNDIHNRIIRYNDSHDFASDEVFSGSHHDSVDNIEPDSFLQDDMEYNFSAIWNNVKTYFIENKEKVIAIAVAILIILLAVVISMSSCNNNNDNVSGKTDISSNNSTDDISDNLTGDNGDGSTNSIVVAPDEDATPSPSATVSADASASPLPTASSKPKETTSPTANAGSSKTKAPVSPTTPATSTPVATTAPVVTVAPATQAPVATKTPATQAPVATPEPEPTPTPEPVPDLTGSISVIDNPNSFFVSHWPTLTTIKIKNNTDSLISDWKLQVTYSNSRGHLDHVINNSSLIINGANNNRLLTISPKFADMYIEANKEITVNIYSTQKFSPDEVSFTLSN